MGTKSIIIGGVGGQGIILSSNIISNALFIHGFDVKKSEIHGMSQREGSVVSYIKYGEKVHSPLISDQEADFLLSFEQLEAYRYQQQLKKDALVVINMVRIDPVPVKLGKAVYPEEMPQEFKDKTEFIEKVNALSEAKKIGNPKVANVFLTGVLSKHIDIDEKSWIEAIKTTVKKDFIDINIEAFKTGRNYQ